MTGKDIAAEFDYDDARGATKILRTHGGLEGLLLNVLGAPKTSVEEGDIVTLDLGGGSVGTGVYNGYCVICVTPDGLSRVNENAILEAW